MSIKNLGSGGGQKKEGQVGDVGAWQRRMKKNARTEKMEGKEVNGHTQAP